MNVFAGTAVCATLAGLGAAALLFAPELGERPGVVTRSVASVSVKAVDRLDDLVRLVEPPDAPEPIAATAFVEAVPGLPPSFALDLTFASAPLRPSVIDGSPVFSADLGASREIPSGAGAILLHRVEPGGVPPAESPPLSGDATPPPLARMAALTVLQVRPPLRPAFSDAPNPGPPAGLAPAVPEPQGASLGSRSMAGTESERGFVVPFEPAYVPLQPAPGAYETAAAPEAPFTRAPAIRGQTGVASWYGPGFHGRRTASGERFNQHDLTAAHPHLPFGSRVRVVDERSGRSVVVRINDRGPFKPGRIIDLSKGSAQALGMGGLARVKLVSAGD